MPRDKSQDQILPQKFFVRSQFYFVWDMPVTITLANTKGRSTRVRSLSRT